MGTDSEQDGGPVNTAGMDTGAAGRVKVSFTLEITHQDGSVTTQQCTGTVSEITNG
jgi:hypothetical protein